MTRVELGLLLLLALAAATPGLAQDDPPTGESERRPLVFASPPAGWRARPAEEKPYVFDYDLPAAEGAPGARVNVLFYPLGFDDYREKLLGRWRHADGTPLTRSDQTVEQLDIGALRLRIIDQTGTYEPRGGPANPGWRLLAGHIRAPHGKWSVWLIGPAAEVETHREEWLAWVRSVREVDQTGDVRPPACFPCTPGSPEPAAAPQLDVRSVHGAPPHGTPNPWTLLGQRLGGDALARLGASRNDGWQLRVTLRSPAGALPALDGLLVATGASPGKGNLLHEGVEAGPVEVVVAHRPSGRVLTYRVTDATAARLSGAASSDFPAVARELVGRSEADLFQVTESRLER